MKGFDDEFTDFADYILRITDRIWLEKNIGAISRYYSEDCVIHTLGGPIIGSEAVINGTVKTLAAFPDRRLKAEDVIWCGDDHAGYYSSHRIISPGMTNLGHSEFGPPTGKQATVRTIADCAARENRIYEEWLVRDNLGLVQQLGFDPHDVARRQAQEDRANTVLQSWLADEIDRVRRTDDHVYSSPPDPCSETNEFVRYVLQMHWRTRDSDIMGSSRAESLVFHGPGTRELQGRAETGRYYADILATLSDTRVSVDHVCAMPRAGGVLDVALRWSLAGRHDTDGIYGSASGRDLLILAVSHWHISDGLINEEWTVFDELAVLRQIYTVK